MLKLRGALYPGCMYGILQSWVGPSSLPCCIHPLDIILSVIPPHAERPRFPGPLLAAGLLWEAMLTPNGRGVSLGLLARLVLCRLQAEPVRDAAEASALPRPSAP